MVLSSVPARIVLSTVDSSKTDRLMLRGIGVWPAAGEVGGRGGEHGVAGGVPAGADELEEVDDQTVSCSEGWPSASGPVVLTVRCPAARASRSRRKVTRWRWLGYGDGRVLHRSCF